VGDDAPQLPDKPKRRTFSSEYKLRIVAEYDACEGDGDKGALLRREGLYSSHVVEWRRARDAAAAAGSDRPRRAKANRDAVALAKATKKIERLEEDLARHRLALTSREKRTRSWRCLPRARPTTPRRHSGGITGRSGDRVLLRRAEAAGRHRRRVSGIGALQGHALPAARPAGARAARSPLDAPQCPV